MILKGSLICFIFIFVNASANHQKLQAVLSNYARPVSILYVSKKPSWLNTKECDVVTYWTQDKSFINKLHEYKPPNCNVITTRLTKRRMKELTDWEYFDVAIIDLSFTEYDETHIVHPAEHNFISATGQLGEETIYFFHPKNEISKRKYRGLLNIESTPDHIYMIKRSQKKICWLPGICFKKFLELGGVYPKFSVYYDQVYENYLPLVYDDYRAQNMIVQGTTLKSIDYDPQFTYPYPMGEEFDIKRAKTTILLGQIESYLNLKTAP